MNRVVKNKGFTLVELMLAMGFVSALLLAIATTVIQIGNIYNRGITFKTVNQAGSFIASELQKSISASSPFDVDGSNSKYVKQSNIGGRLCTGQYSYIWNYGSAMSNADRNKYSSGSDIHFVKAYDANYSYCTLLATGGYPVINPVNTTELLTTKDNDMLAIHSFNITSPNSQKDDATGQRLYNIEFEIGTNEAETYSGSAGDIQCKLANDTASNLSFCSIIKFNIVARAGNAVE